MKHKPSKAPKSIVRSHDRSLNLGKFLHPKKAETSSKPVAFKKAQGTHIPINHKVGNKPKKKPVL